METFQKNELFKNTNMKRTIFLLATAVLTLASCGKSDDNPTPNNPENPKTTEVKRIKEVKITYLKREYVNRR